MEEVKDGKKRHRSPAYPAIGLPEALQRLERFYKDQRRAWVHLNAAYESLGYKAGSSNGGRVVAALISFGLMNDEGTGGSRKVRLSDFGYRLMVLAPDDPERIKAVRDAALKPKIYNDLVARWPEHLPSDSAIRTHLLLDLHFNEEAVAGLIKDFRETYTFAQLGEGSTTSREEEMVGGDEDSGAGEASDEDSTGLDEGEHSAKRTNRTKKQGTNTLVIPIGEGSGAELIYPTGLSPDEFAEMKDYIETFLRVEERKVLRMAAKDE